MEAIATGVEASATRVEAIATSSKNNGTGIILGMVAYQNSQDIRKMLECPLEMDQVESSVYRGFRVGNTMPKFGGMY